MQNSLWPRISIFTLWTLLGATTIALGAIVFGEPMTLNLFDAFVFGSPLSFGLRLDPLSVSLLLMASFLGVVVGQYSIRYMNGEARIGDFFKNLLFTVVSVCLLVTSSNLIMFFAFWLAMSWSLHRLLIFYSNRTNAVYAARKKFIISRIGDLFLLVAIWLVHRSFGTFDFQEIFYSLAGTLSNDQVNLLDWAGLFFVLGAMTKSAQVPFHFWLPETMETPTPVSALMHAGIINAGGFLVLRLSPLISQAHFASLLLASVGALTAAYASMVMVTQNDIKRKLAYSTISQMGLMMFACGIGAYSLALFHILAHSLYKAHAFLSTGDLVEESKKLSLPLEAIKPVAMSFVIGAGLGIVITGLFFKSGFYLPEFTYGAVLFLGLSQNAENFTVAGKYRRRTLALIVSILVVGLGTYLLMETLLKEFLETQLVGSRTLIGPSDPLFLISITGYGIFAFGLWLANGLMKPVSTFDRALYIHFWNGSYFSVASTRFLARLWPARKAS